MKYLLYLFGAAVLVLAFIGLFRLALRQPKRPVTGKYLSRLTALALALLCLAFFWTYDGALTLTAQMSSVGHISEVFYFGRSGDAAAYSTVLNETGEVKFTLPKGVNVHLIRFDPVEGEGDFILSDMQLKAFGAPVETFSNEQLFDGLYSDNIPVMELTEDGIHFVTEDNDPISMLPDAITVTLNNYIRVYSILTLVGSALLGLFVNWIFVGRRIQAFFDRGLSLLRGWFERIGIHPAAMVIACIHFLFCFYLQHTVFYFEAQYLNHIIFYECLFFALLQILWQVIFNVVRKVRRRDQPTLDFLKFFGIYFGIMFGFLLLIWPGYLSWDEYCEIYAGTRWEIVALYHFLVQDSFTLMQMLVPGIGGANLFPCLLCSTVVGYVFREIYTRCGRTKWIYLLYIPMVFPAVLMENFQWQKSPPSTYIEILLLCKIACAALDDRKLNVKDIIEWTLLTAVTFVLRTDGFYYIVLGPAFVILFFHKKTRRSMLTLLTIGTIVLSCLFQGIQNGGINRAYYTLLMEGRMVYAPLVEADPVKDAEELKQLNKLFDVEAYRTRDMDGANYGVLEECDPYTVTDAELSSFKSNIVKLILKHPLVYLRQQFEKFVMTQGSYEKFAQSAQYQKTSGVGLAGPYYEEWNMDDFSNQRMVEINSNPLNANISSKLRANVMLFCEGRDIHDSSVVTIREKLFYNLIPGILFLLLLWVYLLKRKQYMMFSIVTLFLLRLPIVFISAPFAIFHYYMRFFVVGNAIPFFFLVRYLSRKKEAHLAEK